MDLPLPEAQVTPKKGMVCPKPLTEPVAPALRNLQERVLTSPLTGINYKMIDEEGPIPKTPSVLRPSQFPKTPHFANQTICFDSPGLDSAPDNLFGTIYVF